MRGMTHQLTRRQLLKRSLAASIARLGASMFISGIPLAALCGSNKKTTISAAVRVRVNAGDGAVNATNTLSTRIHEKTNKTVVGPTIDMWNGFVNASLSTAAQEVAAVDAGTYRFAFVTNISGSALNQTGATVTPCTWFNAANGVAGYIFNLLGVAQTAAQFAAAGGSVSGDGYTIVLPSGWYARSDPAAGLTLNAGVPYFVQMEETKPTAGTSRRANYGAYQRADLGDATKLSSSPGSLVFSTNWTGASQATGSTMQSPTAIFGTSLSGEKCAAVAGDSIITETGDFTVGTTTINGDADGCCAFANRALNAGGYSWVRASIPGTKATSEYNYGGNAIRKLVMRFSSAIITDMGHNDRSMPLAGAAGTGFKATYRWYWNQLRSAGLGGKAKVYTTDLLAKTTSTDNWTTTANQTDVSGTYQFSQLNPYLQNSAAFDTSLGDPDGMFSIVSAIQNAAYLTAAGYTDVSPNKFPCNGVAYGGGRDGTHPPGPLYNVVAQQLSPQLPTLFGF